MTGFPMFMEAIGQAGAAIIFMMALLAYMVYKRVL